MEEEWRIWISTLLHFTIFTDNPKAWNFINKSRYCLLSFFVFISSTLIYYCVYVCCAIYLYSLILFLSWLSNLENLECWISISSTWKKKHLQKFYNHFTFDMLSIEATWQVCDSLFFLCPLLLSVNHYILHNKPWQSFTLRDPHHIKI